MSKGILIIAVIFFSIHLFGCSKQEAEVKESEEFLSLEALATSKTEDATLPETKTQAVLSPEVTEIKLEPLPPPGPYKPTVKEIQTALKNAGFYTGLVDGKAGPLTKQAIKEFQQANALEADGKVGPKTWSKLSNHLNTSVEAKNKEIGN